MVNMEKRSRGRSEYTARCSTSVLGIYPLHCTPSVCLTSFVEYPRTAQGLLRIRNSKVQFPVQDDPPPDAGTSPLDRGKAAAEPFTIRSKTADRGSLGAKWIVVSHCFRYIRERSDDGRISRSVLKALNCSVFEGLARFCFRRVLGFCRLDRKNIHGVVRQRCCGIGTKTS